MKDHKGLLKKIWILVLILLLETINLPLISVKPLALELSGKPVIANIDSNDEEIAYSLKDLNSILKKHLEQRETSFKIKYKADTSNLKSLIGDGIDGILKSDDYLESCIKSYKCSYEGYQNDVTVNFDFNFYTTKIQEDYVRSQVTSILKNIIKVSMNDHQKEKAIHDYIVAHVAYDTTLSRYSAYEALKNGTTVCNGYAQLAYKMLNGSGIQAKIVVGTGNGGNHAWNLVKLDNIWYHLDCTWDDPVPDVKGRVLYNYFNLNDKKILEDHTFEKLDYPAATKAYENKTPIFDENEFVKWTEADSVNKVVSTKEWNINFNKEVNELSLKDKIFICKQGTKLSFPTILQLSVDKKSITIKHNTPFEPGENYRIYISKEVNDINRDINLKSSVKMDFTIFN